jgi:hypothetical protein
MAASGGSLMFLIRDCVTLVAFPQAMMIGRVVFMLICYTFIAYLGYGKPSGRVYTH